MSIGEEIVSILIYNGDILNIVLNWVMLTVSFLPFLYQSFINLGVILRRDSNYWFFHFMLYFIFQIALCLGIGCYGISIVWNAMVRIFFEMKFQISLID